MTCFPAVGADAGSTLSPSAGPDALQTERQETKPARLLVCFSEAQTGSPWLIARVDRATSARPMIGTIVPSLARKLNAPPQGAKQNPSCQVGSHTVPRRGGRMFARPEVCAAPPGRRSAAQDAGAAPVDKTTIVSAGWDVRGLMKPPQASLGRCTGHGPPRCVRARRSHFEIAENR